MRVRLEIEPRRARMAAPAELRGDEIDAVIGGLRAQAGLHGAVGAFLDERPDFHAVDAASVVDQTFRVFGRRAGLRKHAARRSVAFEL